jgi:hypothetical protein
MKRSRRHLERREVGVIKPVQAHTDHNPFDRSGPRTFAAMSAMSAMSALIHAGISAYFNQNAADFSTVDP